MRDVRQEPVRLPVRDPNGGSVRVQGRADVEDVDGAREVDEERIEREEPPGADPARNLLAATSAPERNTRELTACRSRT